MQVKICGVTRLDNALACVDAGADLLGLNFYPPSPRFVSLEQAARLAEGLRGSAVKLVGVFVNAGAEEIRTALRTCGLDLAQLSGDEPPELLAALGHAAFKALRPADEAALQEDLRRYPPGLQAPAYLLDAHRAGAYGGTGLAADWSLAAGLARRAPLLLAGGLTPDNVAEAVRRVQPWGVDVASGVELAPGIKDPALVRAFIRAAKGLLPEAH